MQSKKTPLYQKCIEAGGRMIPFAGWEMPVTYTGLINEHHCVRKSIGLFDISHMGVLTLEGENVKQVMQKLVPTDLNRIGPKEACYTVLLNETGGILDDVIIYDIHNTETLGDKMLVVINAACSEKDTKWLKKHLEPVGVNVSNTIERHVLLALQGPNSPALINEITDQSIKNLPRFGHQRIHINKTKKQFPDPIFISRTGYTGEEGFELLLNARDGNNLWEEFLDLGITPCGLGARDTLRLEAGMHLYGNDMNATTSPLEAGLGWLVHLETTHEFLGRGVLEKQAEEGISKKLVGIKMEDRTIARAGYKVIVEGKEVGTITSGSWSPTINEAIALAYVPSSLSKIGTNLEVMIRGKTHPAKVAKKPFYRRS